jgi:chromosome segregation ATPase
MSNIYNSLRLKVQDTVPWGKANSMPAAQVKSTNALSLNHEMERFERLVAERIGQLKTLVQAGEAMAVEEGRQLDSLKAHTVVLETKLREADESIGRKDFSHQEIERTLTAEIKNLQNLIGKKDQMLAKRDKEMNDYRSKIDDHVKQIGELELANSKMTEEVASYATRADDLAESSQAKITALESHIKETEELARKKESGIKELAAKMEEVESLAKEQQDLLTRRDSEISDLKSQLKRLTTGIGEVSSFFRQAAALTGIIETQDVSPAAQDRPVEVRVEKSAAGQSNIAKVPPRISEAREEIVSPEVFQRIISELAEVTNIIGNLASLLVRRHAKALGESIEKFPRTRLPELLEALATEISDKKLQTAFRQRLAQSAQISLN